MPRNISNNCVIIFGHSQQFCLWFIYWWYIRHEISASPFPFGATLHLTKAWYKFPTFVLALVCIYFSWYMFVAEKKIASIQCHLVLNTNIFQLSTTTMKNCKCFVRNMCICHPIIYSGICEGNSQHSMLYFYKETHSFTK